MAAGNLLALFGPNSYYTALGLGNTLAGKVAAGAVQFHSLSVMPNLLMGMEHEGRLLTPTEEGVWGTVGRVAEEDTIPTDFVRSIVPFPQHWGFVGIRALRCIWLCMKSF